MTVCNAAESCSRVTSIVAYHHPGSLKIREVDDVETERELSCNSRREASTQDEWVFTRQETQAELAES